MSKVNSQSLNRIVDANFNRAKEGLRVCEDVCRFILDQRSLTADYKDIRHRLSLLWSKLGGKQMVAGRDTRHDVGTASLKAEFSRRNVQDIFYANSQRIKESIRVLEEFAKLKDLPAAAGLKKLRYRIYAVERSVLKRWR